MPDSVLMFRGQRLSARETHLARHAYLMAIDDAASGQLIASPEKRFPLPKVTRPRVIADPDYPETRWCVRNGQIMHYDSDIKVMAYPSSQRVKLWADLLANPTEEVEAE